MLNIVESSKSVQEIVDEIVKIAPDHKFGVLHIHKIQDILKSKGFPIENECQVLDICSPSVANELLVNDITLSSILPCKIAVFTKNAKTNISLNSVVQLVDDINPDLTDLASSVQESLLKIIEEVR